MSEKKPTLIIGGGISGITAAVEIAETGNEVILIEKEAYLGGNVVRMNNYFPKLCPPLCGLEINFKRIRQNPRIKYMVNTKVDQISGEKGSFIVKVTSLPSFIKNNCTACGKCVDACPEKRPDEFNYKMSETKAIYLPHQGAFPMKYNIDQKFCKKSSCAKCVEMCEYNAIDLEAKEISENIEVKNIIIATGWKNNDASQIKGLQYNRFPNVVTNVQFERILDDEGPTGGRILRPSDSEKPKDNTFIQCAGSRDENHLKYCSAVCCSATLKHALNIATVNPEVKVNIFYIDLRVTGRNEDLLNKVIDQKNIKLIKGKVAKIEKAFQNDNMSVEAEDIMSGKIIKQNTEMVVLATGIIPSDPDFEIEKDQYGFILANDQSGIYPISCCKKPMDVSSSVKEATGAALLAIQND